MRLGESRWCKHEKNEKWCRECKKEKNHGKPILLAAPTVQKLQELMAGRKALHAIEQSDVTHEFYVRVVAP